MLGALFAALLIAVVLRIGEHLSSTPWLDSQDGPRPPLDDMGISIALESVATLEPQLVGLANAGDGSGRLFAVEQSGRIFVVSDGRVAARPFLDIRDRVTSGGEQGLLGLAFAPDYAASGRFYVNYTRGDGSGESVVSRFVVSDDPGAADASSETILLTVEQPARNHNGGCIAFGPDGYLYIGFGDGGEAGDPWDHAESLDTLLGKLLRIDVSGADGYSVPSDNPFVDRPGARPEIWAYGLRNPWRFSFDRETGDLYIADVGQNLYEEVNLQPASSAGGEHYGWDSREGAHCFEPEAGCASVGLVDPIAEYGHDLGCSVTGGAVYRGAAHSELTGVYFFADFCSGEIWALRREADGWRSGRVFAEALAISSFGEDEEGELYVVDLRGELFRVIAP